MREEGSTFNELKIVYSINYVGKIGQIHAENETRPLSYRTHKNKFKMDQRVKCRPKIIKIVENIGNKISDIACSNILSDISPQARETKEKKINK